MATVLKDKKYYICAICNASNDFDEITEASYPLLATTQAGSHLSLGENGRVVTHYFRTFLSDLWKSDLNRAGRGEGES